MVKRIWNILNGFGKDLKRIYWPMTRHYIHILNITIGTMVFGWLLIQNNQNVVERVEIFPEGFSNVMGTFMILLSIIKTLLIFNGVSRMKKYVLIGITLCWVTITWAYLINLTQNTGSIISAMITIGCYIELWRGEYVG